MEKIIDIHAHAFPEKIVDKAIDNLARHYGITIKNSGRVADLLASMRAAGVSRAVFFTVATHPDQVRQANDWILAQARAHSTLIPFGTIHPDFADWRAELDRIAAAGVLGIKFHPDFQAFYPDEPRCLDLYEAILERGLLILFHAGDEKLPYATPARLAKVVRTFRGERIILAHLGGYAQWEEAEREIIGLPVYLDTSSVSWRLSPARVWELIRRHGVEKILFGTDYPICTHREALATIQAGATAAEKRLILAENAVRLLNIPSARSRAYPARG